MSWLLLRMKKTALPVCGRAAPSFPFPGRTVADPRPYSAEDFRRRVAARLTHDGPMMGDHVFNPEIADDTGGLRAHAGQIAFPGGRVDPVDAGPEAAALREAGEEIGLAPEFVETVGRAPDYLTGSGYHVAVVVALVRPGFELKLNPAEVADVFEVPLSFLMDAANHRQGSRIWKGAKRNFFEMPFENRNIWGITAGIVRILYERLYAEPPTTWTPS
jgi:8-oxo-dGTP pyrophosphatase MutT (NUDIX family)